MKLVVGLGNPGDEYKNTRHNVGFMVVDALAKRPIDGVMLVKPETFMNRSGEAVKKLMTNYKCQITNLYVVHDDLDIPLGKYKIQLRKGPKEHRGILSIEQSLGRKDFWRVRVGVDNRQATSHKLQATNGDEYVLSDFPKREKKVIDRVINKVTSELVRLLDKKTENLTN
jgi:peptidyl-tRNA hydrolase, PTH1 family